MTIEFGVFGKPVPMARPRVTAHGTYTPKRCRDYKAAVAAAAKKKMRGMEMFDGAVMCHIRLFYKVPKSYTKEKRMAAENNIILPVGRNTGDADNHAKAIMDALTGIVWRDDSQVTYLVVSKLYGSEDWAEIKIRDDVRA